MSSNDHPQLRVAVVYHFFAHYRRAIVERLALDPDRQWTFIGDLRDYASDVEPAQLSSKVHFERCRCVRLVGGFMWQRGLLLHLLVKRYDAVIFLGADRFLATWIAAAMLRLLGTRVLFWTHGYTRRPGGAGAVFRKTFYSLANGLLMYGRWAKTVAIEQGFAPERVHVIGNSLDFDAQQAALNATSFLRAAQVRRELFDDDVTPVVSCTTRLVAHRRLDMLLRAAGRLLQLGNPVNIVLVGDGPERGRLEQLAAELKVRVAFTGACYDESRISEILAATNVVVAPGMVGLSAMHALAYGVPVVSQDNPETQMPEFEAIVPGVTGSLFKEGDVDALVDAIRPWIQNSWVEPGVRSACRDLIRRFWSPEFQFQTITRAVDGHQADDVYWLRLPQLQTRVRGNA
jgi:glycosyltransferase involved in cell wall biosynthesis